MTRITRFRLLLWAAGLSAIYFILAAFIPPPYVIDALNGAFLGVGLAVAIIYIPLIADALISNRFDRGSQLSIGIGLLWLSIFMSRAWSTYYRYNGSPDNLLNHPFIGYVVFVACIGGALFVTAPGYYSNGNIKPTFGGKNLKLVVVFGIVGAIASIVSHYHGTEGLRTLIHFNERN